jgi:hypothetical protein
LNSRGSGILPLNSLRLEAGATGEFIAQPWTFSVARRGK